MTTYNNPILAWPNLVYSLHVWHTATRSFYSEGFALLPQITALSED